MAETAEVAIIGGGLIGCSVAYYLAKKGVKALVLERNELGSQASGANAGLLCPQAEAAGPGPYLDLRLASAALYPSLGEELAADFQYRRSGLFRVFLDEENIAHGQQVLAWQRQLGLSVEMLSAEEIQRRQPNFTRQVLGALYFPNEASANPLSLLFGYAAAALRGGTRILPHTPVHSIEVEGGRVQGLTTSRGPISCPSVVNAAGPWAGPLAERAGLSLPVRPVRGQIVLTEQVPPLFEEYIFFKGGYLVREASGNVIIGSTRELVGYNKGVTVAAIQGLAQNAMEVIPSLGQTAFIRAWAGLRPYVADELPVIGYAPGVEGLLVATAHFRSGCLLSAITGKLLSDLIVDGRPSIPLEPFSPSRFQPGKVAVA